METHKVRGRTVKVVKATNLSELGSKFFGITRWVVEDMATGDRFEISGKRIAHNSKLYAHNAERG